MGKSLTPGFSEKLCPLVMGGIAAVSTIMNTVAESQQAHANASAIEGQEKLQQNQIAVAAGNEESNAAKEARAAQAQSIVAAGAAGINTGSNSFLASLQTTAMNASQQESVIQESEQNSEAGSIAQANSELAQSASSPTFIGGSLDAALSGASAYASSSMMEHAYDGAPTEAASSSPYGILDYSGSTNKANG